MEKQTDMLDEFHFSFCLMIASYPCFTAKFNKIFGLFLRISATSFNMQLIAACRVYKNLRQFLDNALEGGNSFLVRKVLAKQEGVHTIIARIVII